MIRVVLAGAHGRMGRLLGAALRDASDIDLVGELGSGDDAEACLTDADPQVLVDFTVASASQALVTAAVERDISPVIGTSGWRDDALAALAEACAERSLGALLVPNFSLGAVLQMRFARQAAASLHCTGIREVHHPGKRDTPSGTALATALRIAAAGAHPPAIASARREGAVAEQTVDFAGAGETLSLHHRVVDRSAYVPGVLLAVRRVRGLAGLELGLDSLIAPRD